VTREPGIVLCPPGDDPLSDAEDSACDDEKSDCSVRFFNSENHAPSVDTAPSKLSDSARLKRMVEEASRTSRRRRVTSPARQQRSRPRLRWWYPLLIPSVVLVLIAIGEGSEGVHVVHSTFLGSLIGVFVLCAWAAVPAFIAGVLWKRDRP